MQVISIYKRSKYCRVAEKDFAMLCMVKQNFVPNPKSFSNNVKYQQMNVVKSKFGKKMLKFNILRQTCCIIFQFRFSYMQFENMNIVLLYSYSYILIIFHAIFCSNELQGVRLRAGKLQIILARISGFEPVTLRTLLPLSYIPFPYHVCMSHKQPAL